MDKKGYSITIQDLLERPIIRNDFEEEWMNKMTGEELSQFDKNLINYVLKREHQRNTLR
jgi:hypothetical protein